MYNDIEKKGGFNMNKDILQGNWKQWKGKVKETWGKLTDDEITKIEGSWDKLCGTLQKQYGWDKQRAEDEISKFTQKHGGSSTTKTEKTTW